MTFDRVAYKSYLNKATVRAKFDISRKKDHKHDTQTTGMITSHHKSIPGGNKSTNANFSKFGFFYIFNT